MPLSRRKFLKKGAAVAAGLTAAGSAAAESKADGPFQPTWESLQQYRCPEWFRDAKFGIWAHWSAQCVPEMGDWYARQMYEQGNPDYNFHVQHYGHPSKVGFKDIDHIWHAENWEPERLIDLYKSAGAKYFVALANHHDNFDCYDSRYQPWNSVKIGPKKDIVGTWARAARAAGLRFGVTCHASRAWSWFEVAQGADKTGPLAGVPYDGKLTKADGKGQWWEGFDPQDLYAQNHAPGKTLEWNWDAAKGSSVPDKAYCEKFYNRVIDLLDKYHPDLLYFDDNVLPLYPISDVGLRIAAYYYNTNMKRHGGRLQAVLNGKGLNPQQAMCMVHDFERGRSDQIAPHPWQTDTCIGEWHYRRSLYTQHRYKTVEQVVRMLADIVSKNGTLLLNIPVRGDGTIDEDEIAFVRGMADWMRANGEAIYGTRPWKIAGEGPIKIKGGGFSEGGEDKLTAEDFRFTTKGNTLYAVAMGWPANGRYVVRTLAANAPGIRGEVKGVQLLGSNDRLPFTRTAEGLVVTVPRERTGEHAWVLKIAGVDVGASEPVAPAPPPPPLARADPDGTIHLVPDSAALHGHIQVEQRAGFPNIGYWDDPKDTATWKVHFDAPGEYTVTVKTSAANGDTEFELDASTGTFVMVHVPQTAGWDAYQTVTAGTLKIPAAGDHLLIVRPANRITWKPMNLASVTLKRMP